MAYQYRPVIDTDTPRYLQARYSMPAPKQAKPAPVRSNVYGGKKFWSPSVANKPQPQLYKVKPAGKTNGRYSFADGYNGKVGNSSVKAAPGYTGKGRYEPDIMTDRSVESVVTRLPPPYQDGPGGQKREVLKRSNHKVKYVQDIVREEMNNGKTVSPGDDEDKENKGLTINLYMQGDPTQTGGRTPEVKLAGKTSTGSVPEVNVYPRHSIDTTSSRYVDPQLPTGKKRTETFSKVPHDYGNVSPSRYDPVQPRNNFERRLDQQIQEDLLQQRREQNSRNGDAYSDSLRSNSRGLETPADLKKISAKHYLRKKGRESSFTQTVPLKPSPSGQNVEQIQTRYRMLRAEGRLSRASDSSSLQTEYLIRSRQRQRQTSTTESRATSPFTPQDLLSGLPQQMERGTSPGIPESPSKERGTSPGRPVPGTKIVKEVQIQADIQHRVKGAVPSEMATQTQPDASSRDVGIGTDMQPDATILPSDDKVSTPAQSQSEIPQPGVPYQPGVPPHKLYHGNTMYKKISKLLRQEGDPSPGLSDADSGFHVDAGIPPGEDDEEMEYGTSDDEMEIYVVYMQTEDGSVIGPLKLDIDSVQIGLPSVAPEEGLRNRQTGTNSVNEHSSRSHSMLTLHIDSEYTDPEDDNLYVTKHGKLTFVDLAGSEKTKTDASMSAHHLAETNNINKSLLVLGNCISSLGDSKKRHGHIPYRDSKLTKLLADSLGGGGVTLMIACVSPTMMNAGETMNTLRYANRAKKIKSKPVIKMDPREKLILSLKKEIKILRQENHYLRQQLEFPVKPKGQLQKENDAKFLQLLRDQRKDGKTVSDHGLYEMLQEYMIENETLRTENSDLHGLRDQTRREQQMLSRENERLLRRVERLEKETDHIVPHTPLSLYNPGSPGSSRHSSAVDVNGQQWAPKPLPSESPRGRSMNGVGPPPPQRGGVRQQNQRPPHHLSDSIDQSNAGDTPRKSYQGRPPPQRQPKQSQQRQRPDQQPVPAPRSRGLEQQESPRREMRRASHPSDLNSRPPGTADTTASTQEMNDRLRQELLDLEDQIKQEARDNQEGRGQDRQDQTDRSQRGSPSKKAGKAFVIANTPR